MLNGIASAEQPANPLIDYQGFSRKTAELEALHESHRISEDEFIKMSAEPGTIILDARTRDKYESIHIKGARHLAFTDFTEADLRAVIPDKGTRVLIYCNNNFKNELVNFVSKNAIVSLNIQTFINLHAYGYTNIYELAPLLDVKTTLIPFEGNSIIQIKSLSKAPR